MNKLAYAIATVGLAFASVYAYAQNERYIGFSFGVMSVFLSVSMVSNTKHHD